MKKVLSLVLLISLSILALVSCGGNGEKGSNTDKTTVDFTTPATDTENFVYDGKTITGLTEQGKTKKTLTLPADADTLDVRAFATSSALETLVIGERTATITLNNGCFSGTNGLNVYIGCGTEQVKCGNSGLLDGATGLTFRIVKAEYSNFKNDYTWANYSDNMAKYE